MFHYFLPIVARIYKRGMFLEALNTNGFYINQAALDQMKELVCDPLIKISFDGLGHHDWLRNRKGAGRHGRLQNTHRPRLHHRQQNERRSF